MLQFWFLNNNFNAFVTIKSFKVILNYKINMCAQVCPTLCDPMDCSPPGFSVHGIISAGIQEWVAIPFSRVFSWPGIKSTSLVSPAWDGPILNYIGILKTEPELYLELVGFIVTWWNQKKKKNDIFWWLKQTASFFDICPRYIDEIKLLVLQEVKLLQNLILFWNIKFPCWYHSREREISLCWQYIPWL